MASLPLPRWNLAITLPASGPRLWRREWWSTLTLTGIAAKDWDSIAKKEKLDVSTVPAITFFFKHSNSGPVCFSLWNVDCEMDKHLNKLAVSLFVSANLGD